MKILLLTKKEYHYFYTWRLLPMLFTVFFLVVFCYLGTWQIHRYHFKTQLLSQYQTQHNAAAKPLKQLLPLEDHPFAHIRVTGHYLNRLTLLLQHQFYRGRNGYDVITAFKPDTSQQLLWVDRGWIAKDSATKLDAPEKRQTIRGYVKLISTKGFMLGKNILDPDLQPLQLQRLDIEQLSQLTGERYFAAMVRLDPNQPHGFVREWPVITMQPERHLGYAIQWFAMALALLIAYAAFSISRQERFANA